MGGGKGMRARCANKKLRGTKNEIRTKRKRNEIGLYRIIRSAQGAHTKRSRDEGVRTSTPTKPQPHTGADCTRHERYLDSPRRRGANEHSDEAAAAHGRGLHMTRTISRGDRVARRGSADEHSDEAAAAHGRGLHTTRTIRTRKGDCRWPGCHGGRASASVRQSMQCRGWTPISADLRLQNMHNCCTGRGSLRAANHKCEKRHSEPLRHAPRRQKLKQRGEPAASV